MKENSILLLIIADDLTGANDAGVQFAKKGIATVVLVHSRGAELPRGYQAVVVNTESRHVAAEEAARRVRHVAQVGLATGVPYFFKKTDSTLRGNIGAELKALLEATGEDCLPFVPAFPEMGRTTRGGIHYVNGVPISQTAFATDPLSPVRESEVAKVLHQTSDLQVTNCSVETMEKMPAAGDCVVIDCEARADLTAIARHFREAHQRRVLAGSAAFAEELPALLGLKPSRQENTNPEGPILFVNGSLHPRAFEQVAAVREQFHLLRLSPEILLGPQFIKTEPSLPKNGDLLLYTLENREQSGAFRDKARNVGVADAALHLEVANGLGRVVKAALHRGRFRTLIVFGGDTLMGIARSMEWDAFIPRMELEPGITTATPLRSDLLVVSKAGGFGDREAACRIVRSIRRPKPQSG